MKDTIVDLLRQRPFRPFTIQMSNGESFQVTHPETAVLTKSSLVVAQPDSDDIDICSFLHIANFVTNEPAVTGS